MKTLDLATLGVAEMNGIEMENVHGGQAGRNNLPNAPMCFYMIAPGSAFLYDVFVSSFNR